MSNLQRHARAVAFVVLAVLGVAPVSITRARPARIAGIAGTAKPGVPYLDSTGERLAIFSNSSWVPSPGSGHAVQVATSIDPIGLYTIPGGDRPFYMWTNNCKAGVQHVTFDRKLFIPGPPSQLYVRADARSVTGWPSTIRSIQLFVNGHLFAGSRTSSSFDEVLNGIPPDPRLAFFHYGSNHLQLEVTKNALAASLHPCRGSNSRRIGVRFGLEGGSFPTDLAVTGPGTHPPVYYRVTPGAVYPTGFQWTVSNNGPAATLFGGSDLANLSGATGITVYSSGMEISTRDYPDWESGLPFVVQAKAPFDASRCALATDRIICPGSGWFIPGTSTTLAAHWFQHAPTGEPDDTIGSTQIGWGVAQGGPSPDEINQDNNTGSVTIYWCWPAAMSGGCATATPPG